MKFQSLVSLFVLAVIASACALTSSDEPIPGPDKQGMGLVTGALTGAGAGAVTGAQLGSLTGPGAVVGAGFGAVYGSIKGLAIDMLEEEQIARQQEMQDARQTAWAQEQIAEHYQRRLELHPNRDIFPADIFFDSDSAQVSEFSKPLARELARLNKNRLSASRILVVSYLTTSDATSAYARHMTERRAENLAMELVLSGIDPRRVVTQGVVLSQPLLIDPYDKIDRYRQALEIVALDY